MLASPSRGLFISLAVAVAVSAFIPAAAGEPSPPRTSGRLLDGAPSSISAAPAFLPVVPRFSTFPPASPPDGMPVFPTPLGAGAAAPAESMPIIPSNPSPPEPDQFGPTSALAPLGSSSAAAAAPSAALSRSWRRAGSVQVTAALLFVFLLPLL